MGISGAGERDHDHTLHAPIQPCADETEAEGWLDVAIFLRWCETSRCCQSKHSAHAVTRRESDGRHPQASEGHTVCCSAWNPGSGECV